MLLNDVNFDRVHRYIKDVMDKIIRPSTSALPLPYTSITTDESIYGKTMFCWDNHFMAIRYAYDDRPEFFKYLIDNLFFYQNKDGFVCNCINKDNGSVSLKNFHVQPFLMQSAYYYYNATKDIEWVKSKFRKLEKYLEYYEQKMKKKSGLFAWTETYMSGIDNDISTTFFKPGTVISPDLSSRIYLEYKAASILSKSLGNDKKSREYLEKAIKLKELINSLLWNEEYQTYTAWDSISEESIFKYRDETLNKIGIGLYSFCSCSNFLPLYAGIADLKSASAMIKKYIINPNHFYSKYGIRSISKASEYYNNAVWGNAPRFGDLKNLTTSNWQGPVWILNCYFVANILINYGFISEAEDLNNRTLELLAKSLDTIGSFTENYNAETGIPLYVEKFTSWNILADIISYEIEYPKKRIITQLLK